MFKSLLFFIAMLCYSFLHAQTATVSGVVKDSTGTVLSYTNILAQPVADSLQMTFAITNDKGAYQLKLHRHATYIIKVSYLGYQAQTDTITPNEASMVKNYMMLPEADQLNEVTVNYKIPLVVKEDTLVYTVSAFTKGNENKLRDVLKKLPGVEVDKAGNVTVNGKKVDKVMVDGKTFFTGDSKLAVNNIPADAVDAIEVLDHYSEIPYLKGLEDSDKMAMDVKLKEDKKKFVFGDLEAGGGVKNRYLVHPSVFYYSPKTTVNVIGELNNTGKKSFTFNDYINFEGGYSQLISENRSISPFQNEFTRFLINDDYKSNVTQFGAFNLRKTFSPKTELNSYAIVNHSNVATETNTINEYINTQDNFIENRNNTNKLNNTFLIGKVNFKYQPSYKEDVYAETTVKYSNSKRNQNISSVSPDQQTTINSLQQTDGFMGQQNIKYSKKFTSHQTIAVESSFHVEQNTPETQWFTNQEILQGTIPLEDQEVYHILQNRKNKSLTTDVVIKDYWVLNNTNHIYTTLGNHLSFDHFYNKDAQLLDDNTENDFNDAGFNNDTDYSLLDQFVGLEYKFKIGVTTFKPGIFYHYYHWKTKQANNIYNTYTRAVLPRFSLAAKLKKSNNISFDYALKVNTPNVQKLLSRYVLTNFNSVYKGNTTLENEKYHDFKLSYSKFSMFKGLIMSTYISYRRNLKTIKNTSVLDGINRIATLVMLDNPENRVMINTNFQKTTTVLKYGFNGTFTYNDYFQLLNNTTQKNLSRNYSGRVKAGTVFKKLPNVMFNYNMSASNYITGNTHSYFTNNGFGADLEYVFFKDFSLAAAYDYTHYKNDAIGANTIFNTLSASLQYHKEDSLWTFALSGDNLLNNRYKRSNTISDFIISDQVTYIMPRVIMFKVTYKL
ncbi:outer membrane beta-barrel protein [Zhouia sp. PK063]|uniref:outer membrane beta-barrel protein n=1 Tax=Zhouia sp. PK063 TaxID=3373602 RepID=UPI0037970FF1